MSLQVLSYLSDVRVATLTGEDAGSFKLEFHFRLNPFFSNEVRRGRQQQLGVLPLSLAHHHPSHQLNTSRRQGFQWLLLLAVCRTACYCLAALLFGYSVAVSE